MGIRHRGCPISDTSSSLPNISIRNISRVNTSGNVGRRLLYIRGDEKEVELFEKVCDEHNKIMDIQFISKGDGGQAYYVIEIDYETNNPSVLSIFNSQGIFHYGSIIVQEGVERWLVYSETKATIQELSDKIKSYGNTVSIFRMVDLRELGHINNIEDGLILSQLTSQQRVTFQTALEMGYYDSGSETIVSDVADELDRHETTTWEHLNKAENTILTDIGNRLFSSRNFDDLQISD